MTKALHVADRREINKMEELSFTECSDLVQRHPIIIARQFVVRLIVLIRHIKNNQSCLRNPVLDFRYRLEFQNTGSPHL